VKVIHNLRHSVRDRLLSLAHRERQPYDLVLVRYALERLLYRLSCSEYRDRFVLKGAFLYPVWREAVLRPTRDMDLLGYGPPDVTALVSIFSALCTVDALDDGLEFLPATVRGDEIREGNIYHGVRIRLTVRLASALIPLQVDVGFGDVIVPPAEEVDFPTLLDFPAPHVLAYPRAAVVAEKFEAMVTLGMANSRMKDFYDLWMLAQRSAFDGETLCQALHATFSRRRIPLPADIPLALTSAFAEDAVKQTQWKAFLRKSRLEPVATGLPAVVDALKEFLAAPMRAAAEGGVFLLDWPPGGPWQKRRETTPAAPA
jgi:hypothetical protein